MRRNWPWSRMSPVSLTLTADGGLLGAFKPPPLPSLVGTRRPTVRTKTMNSSPLSSHGRTRALITSCTMLPRSRAAIGSAARRHHCFETLAGSGDAPQSSACFIFSRSTRLLVRIRRFHHFALGDSGHHRRRARMGSPADVMCADPEPGHTALHTAHCSDPHEIRDAPVAWCRLHPSVARLGWEFHLQEAPAPLLGLLFLAPSPTRQ